jgi:predicted chitinase
MEMAITTAIALSELSQEDLKDIQTRLNRLGFDAGNVDGLIGPRTLDAWADFKEEFQLDDPNFIEQIGPSSYDLLKKTSTEAQGKIHDFTTKLGTIAAIRYECNRQGLTLKSQQAYVLATVEHETAGTFKPIEEGDYKGGPRNLKSFQKQLRYYPFFGRGFVQLTWLSNYQKYSQLLGVDLVKNPDLSKNPNIALFVLVHGFKTGAFTGKKIADYINDRKADYVSARRCINGLDRANDIAKLAQKYL